jgi:hypothetical protein
MGVVKKKPKLGAEITKCPECGGSNLLATTKGTMCKTCGAIQSGTAPMAKEQE